MDASTQSRTLRITVIVLAIAGLLVAVRLLPLREWLAFVQSYARDAGAAGYVVYAAVYALCVVLLVPATILTLAAGAIFGTLAGSLVVIAGATAGATIAFLLSRTLLRKRVEARTAANSRFRALDRAIAREGAKIVLLVRLAPVFPFTWVNYAFGLTGVATLPYVLATLVGIVPATVAFVYLSDAAASATAGTGATTRVALEIGGAIAALAASLFIAHLARKAIREAGVEESAPR